MADIVLKNTDGTNQTYTGVTNLLMNTTTGGKAVYTEDSNSTPAYLLQTPTAEKPTYDSLMKAHQADTMVVCAVNDGLADGVYALDGVWMRDTNEFYFYTETEQTISVATMQSFFATWACGDVPLKVGWTYLRSYESGIYARKYPDIAWIQQHLREQGGISVNTFDWTTLDEYIVSLFALTEIAEEKIVQANYAQNDPTQPDYVKNRPGGYKVSKTDSKVYELDYKNIGDSTVVEIPPSALGMTDEEAVENGFEYYRFVNMTTDILTSYQLKGATLGIESTDAEGNVTESSATIIADSVGYDGGICMAYTDADTAVFVIPTDEMYIGEMGVVLTQGVWVMAVSIGGMKAQVKSLTTTATDGTEIEEIPSDAITLPRASEYRIGGIKAKYAPSNATADVYVDSDGFLKHVPNGNVVKTTSSQGLSDTEKQNARENLGLYKNAVFKYGLSIESPTRGSNTLLDYGSCHLLVGYGNAPQTTDFVSNGITSKLMPICVSLFGSNNRSQGQYTIASGDANEIFGDYGATFGRGLSNSGDYQTVIGRYNVADYTSRFIIGNGISGTDRKNIFTVGSDGATYSASTYEGSALILRSTTEGSTKKFKITVDDTGALTTIEVT